jgi:hypothetical protein
MDRVMGDAGRVVNGKREKGASGMERVRAPGGTGVGVAESPEISRRIHPRDSGRIERIGRFSGTKKRPIRSRGNGTDDQR